MTPTDAQAEVAAAKGLPAELADRLLGDTREELERDADQLVGLVQPPSMDGLIRRAARGEPLSSADVGSMDALIRRAAGRA